MAGSVIIMAGERHLDLRFRPYEAQSSEKNGPQSIFHASLLRSLGWGGWGLSPRISVCLHWREAGGRLDPEGVSLARSRVSGDR